MKKISLMLVILLVVTNGYWIYSAIDRAISKTYADASFNSLQGAHNSLISLSTPLLLGRTSAEIRSLAKGKFSEDEIFEKPKGGDAGEDLLVVGWLTFYLDSQGRVTRIGDS